MIVEKTLQHCRNILKNVSRSFALTIPMVEKNIFIPILVGYLEARILDSFEDENTHNIQTEKRIENIKKVISIINNPESLKTSEGIKELTRTAADFISNPHYLDLVQNMDKVISIHKTMDSNSKHAISKWFTKMSNGMQKYLNKRIDTFKHLDEYCYYVGGTVGGFVTELIIKNSKKITPLQIRILKSESNNFGLFLQKTNIIRDFREDILANEKIFWPYSIFQKENVVPHQLLNREYEETAMIILDQMIRNAKKHISSVKKYLYAVPKDYPGYKTASAINFLMAVKTLAKVNKNPDVFYSDQPVKIDKSVKEEILADPINYIQTINENF